MSIKDIFSPKASSTDTGCYGADAYLAFHGRIEDLCAANQTKPAATPKRPSATKP